MTVLNAVSTEILGQPLYDLSDHPQHAGLLGQITARWNAVEVQFMALFAHLLRAPPWRAQPAYEAVVNRNGRMEMIRALAAKMPMRDDFRRRVTDAIDEGRELSRTRNTYVHGYWLLKNGKPYLVTELGLTLADSQKRPVSTTEMEEALTAIRGFESKIANLTTEFGTENPIVVLPGETRKAWREKFPAQP